MNILIVNAFGIERKNLEQFKEFEKLVKSNFTNAFSESGIIDNLTFYSKNMEELEDFLFEKSSIYNSLESLRSFEKLDFIFIDGSERYLPWEKHGLKLAILVKMCMKYEKSLFFFSLGVQIMVFLVASHFLINFNIINSKVEVSCLEELYMIDDKFLAGLKSLDFFLDYVTGDLYSYRLESDEWIPKMNIGLHNRLIAEKIRDRGKYVLSKNQYRPTSSRPQSKTYSVLGTEKRCFITKNHKTHWIFNNLGPELLCENSSDWFVHYFNLKDKSMAFNILLNNDDGPALIEYKSCYGTNFKAKKETQDGVTLIFNFIKKELEDIYKGTKVKLRFEVHKETDENEKSFNNSTIKPKGRLSKRNKDSNITTDNQVTNEDTDNYNNALNKRPVSSAKPRLLSSFGNKPISKIKSPRHEDNNKESILKQISIDSNEIITSSIKYRLLTGKSPIKIPKERPVKMKGVTLNTISNDKSNLSLSTLSEPYIKIIPKRASSGMLNLTTEDKEKTPYQKITQFYTEQVKDTSNKIIVNDSPDAKAKSSPVKLQNQTRPNSKINRLQEEKYKEYNLDPEKIQKLIVEYEKFNRQFFDQEHLDKLFYEGEDKRKIQDKISDEKVLSYYSKLLRNKLSEYNELEEQRKKDQELKYNKLENVKENYNQSFRLSSSSKTVNFKKPSVVEENQTTSKIDEVGAFNMIYPYLNKNDIPKGKKTMFVGQTKEERKILNDLIKLREKDKCNQNPFSSDFVNYKIKTDKTIILNQFKALQSRLQFKKDFNKTEEVKKSIKSKEKKIKEKQYNLPNYQSQKEKEKMKWINEKDFKTSFPKENQDLIRKP